MPSYCFAGLGASPSPGISPHPSNQMILGAPPYSERSRTVLATNPLTVPIGNNENFDEPSHF